MKRRLSAEARIVPEIAGSVRAGTAVQFGWALEIIRYVTEVGDEPPTEPLPESDEPVIDACQVLVNLYEHEGTAMGGSAPRPLVKNIAHKVTFERRSHPRGWYHYDFGRLTVLDPFQDRLKPPGQATYSLQTTVLNPNGDRMALADVTFANQPVYCLWDVEVAPGSLILPANLTGGGRLGFVEVQGPGRVVAHGSDGSVLWERTATHPLAVVGQPPAVVADLNGDGKDDVCCLLGSLEEPRLVVFDGATGDEVASIPWPGSDDPTRWQTSEVNAAGEPLVRASLCLANLRGADRASDLICMTGADNDSLTCALTGDLQELWRFDLRRIRKVHQAGGAPFPVVGDVNADGHDEVVVGTTVLTRTGKIGWSLPFKTHFQQAGSTEDRVTDIALAPVTGGPLLIYANNSLAVDARNGRVHWRAYGVLAGRVGVRRTSLDGSQFLISFVDRFGDDHLYNLQGEEKSFEEPWRGGTVVRWVADASKTCLFHDQMVYDTNERAIGIAPGCDRAGQLGGEGPEILWTSRVGEDPPRARAFSGQAIPADNGPATVFDLSRTLPLD